MKLTLSGRTPMEQFKVPKLFPKARRRFISDAAIAFNSGQVLAANFLLRTFIEQYVRAETDNLQSQDLDDIFAKYGVKLPDDFKQRFPSLKSIYETLSVDIHSATGSQATFLKARKDIETHFDAKRIFESLGK